MKKGLIFVFLIIAAIALCACGGEKPADVGNGVVNPMTDYASLEDVNEACGCILAVPEGLMVSEESFSTIAQEEYPIGQYSFTYDGFAYTLRGTCDFSDDDISGVFGEEDAIPGVDSSADSIVNVDNEIKVARWTNVNGRFSLVVKDNGELDPGVFSDLTDRFMEVTNPATVGIELEAYFAALEGNWIDQTSRRATLTVISMGNNAEAIVSWADSVAENTTWEMTLTLSEDGLLYYDNCVEIKHIYGADGADAPEILSENGEGFFSLGGDGLLYWTGAAEEACAACVFEKEE